MDETALIALAFVALLALSAIPLLCLILTICSMSKLSKLERELERLTGKLPLVDELSKKLSSIEAALWHLKKSPETAQPAAAEPLKAAAPPPAETKRAEPPPQPAPKPQAPPVETPKAQPPPAPQASEFEKGAVETLSKIWSWILVGERDKEVSLEYAIATTWGVRLAIIILLTSIAFGISYSIKNELIGPAGRVALCFAAGLGMALWGLKLAKGKYHIIAQGLLGGGMAALYFSAYASATVYHLVPTGAAFAAMILVTAASCAIAISINSPLMALLGTLGGYATPLALSTGEKNLEALFAYVAMLGCGLMWASLRRDWKILNALSLLFTYAILFGALNEFYDKAADFPIAIGAATAFFLIFSLIPLLFNLRHERKSTALELCFMFVNAAAYFPVAYNLTTGLYCKEWAAAISLALAAFYLAQAAWLIKTKSEDKSLLAMLWAFSAFFVAFTVPLLLSGRWITAAWSLQALAFLWLARRLGSSFLRRTAYAVYALAAFRLLFLDLHANFASLDAHGYWEGIVSRVCTFGFFIGSAAGGWLLLHDGKSGKSLGDAPASRRTASFFLGAGLCVLFLYLHFELRGFSLAVYAPLREPLLTAIWVAASLAALHFSLKLKSGWLGALALLLGLGAAAKLLLFDVHAWSLDLSSLRYSRGSSLEGVAMRAIDFIPAIAALFAGMTLSLRSGEKGNAKVFAAAAIGVLFLYLSFEVKTLTALYLPGFANGAVSVLWGLFALGMIMPGILKDVKALRYAGLILFLATVFKIFLLDMASLSQLAKVAAFAGLGAVILAGAFAYVKFRSVFESKS